MSSSLYSKEQMIRFGSFPPRFRILEEGVLFVFICGVCVVGFSYIAQDGNLPASKVLVSQVTPPVLGSVGG